MLGLRSLAATVVAAVLLSHTPPVPAGVSERTSAITVDGERIPVAVDVPAHGPPRGAVLIVPGAFSSDVNGNYPSQGFYPHTYADIARGLAAAGYVTLRYAKDGTGSGTTIVDPVAAKRHDTFAERVVVAEDALRALRRAAGDVPIAVAGHSEGALVATLLAEREPLVRAVVELEAPGRPIFDLFLAQVRAMAGELQRMGVLTPLQSTASVAAFDAAVAAVRSGLSVPSTALTDHFVRLYFGKATNTELRYLRQEDRIDPARVIVRVAQPVLIVHGSADTLVFAEDARRLDAARKAAGLPTTLVSIPGDQHFYKRVPPDTSPFAALHLAGPTDPTVVRAIAQWLPSALSP